MYRVIKNEEYPKGEVKKGTVDDLMREICCMSTLIWGKTFTKALKRTVKRHSPLNKNIEETMMSSLLEIGTHDEVY